MATSIDHVAQQGAATAKDVWYTGPDTITQDGKTYHRLPRREYATARGPCTENSKIIRAIHDRTIYYNDDTKWILPFEPELVVNANAIVTVDYTRAQPHHGIRCQPNYNGSICNLEGKEVTADVVEKVKAAVVRDPSFQTFNLGDSSAEQPILFINEHVYNDLYRVPSMQAATVDALGDIPVTSVSNAHKFTTEFGIRSVEIQREFIARVQSEPYERIERSIAEYVTTWKNGVEETGLFRAILPTHWPSTWDKNTVIVFGAPPKTIEQYVIDHQDEVVASSEGWSFDLDTVEAAHLHTLVAYNAI